MADHRFQYTYLYSINDYRKSTDVLREYNLLLADYRKSISDSAIRVFSISHYTIAAAGVLCAVAGAMMMMNQSNNCRTLWVWATYTAAAAGCPILSKKCVGVVWSKKKSLKCWRLSRGLSICCIRADAVV